MSVPLSPTALPPTAVVTGFTGEIGFEIAKQLTSEGVQVVLPVRSASKAQPLIEQLKSEVPEAAVTVMPGVDLSSLDSIERFAASITESFDHLDILVNCAAVTAERKTLSADGIELMFAVNVVAYFALMERLAPLLSRSPSAPGRIVNVASDLAGAYDGNDLFFDRRPYSLQAAYQQSKAANRMLTWEAAKRYRGYRIVAHACHPGVVTSPLLQGIAGGSHARGWDSAAQAATTPAFLALSPEAAACTGEFWVRSRRQPCKFQGRAEDREQLWSKCEELASGQRGRA